MDNTYLERSSRDSAVDVTDYIEQLISVIETLEDEKLELEGQVSDLENDLSTLEERVRDLENENEELQNQE